MSNTETRFCIRRTGVAWRQTGDEIVVLDIDRSEYFGFNASAARLWLILQNGATRNQLVAGLTNQLQVTAAEAAVDVDAFLLGLRQRRLVDQS